MTPRRRSAWRLSGPPAALVLLAVMGGQGIGPGPAEEPFRVPEVDLSALPAAVREEAAAAQKRAMASPSDPEAVGQLGARYFAHDFLQAAEVCLERAARLDPKSMKWHYYLGLARRRQGGSAAAIEALRVAAQLDPNYAPVLLELADLHLESDAARSADLYRKAAQIDPEDPRAHLGLGRCARFAGRTEEALGHFRRAIELFPDYAEAHYAAAMALVAAGRREEAREHLRRHRAGASPPLTGDPLRQTLVRMAMSAGTLRKEAERLSRGGDPDQAVHLLERAIETDVSGSTSHTSLGLVLARQGRFQEAADQFRLALQADPASVEARSSLGLALMELGRTEESARLFREVLEQHPRHAPTLIYLGQLLERTGRTEEALEHLRKGVESQPGNGLFQYTLGSALARHGDEEEAMRHLGKATLLLPEHAGAHYTLGVLLAGLGDIAGAKAAWRRTIEISPQNAEAHAGLAGVALTENDAASAVALAEKACELTGYARPPLLETLADAYEAAGRADDAARIRRMIAGRP